MEEKSDHGDILVAIGKLDTKVDSLQSGHKEIKSAIEDNVERIRNIEEYLHEHRGAIRAIKWSMGLLAASAGVLWAIVKWLLATPN